MIDTENAAKISALKYLLL